MYREMYVRTMLFQALTQLAGEMALRTDINPEQIVSDHLVQAQLTIEENGLNETAQGFDYSYPRIYDDLFVRQLKQNAGEHAA